MVPDLPVGEMPCFFWYSAMYSSTDFWRSVR